MSTLRIVHNPSLVAYGVLSVLLSMALFVTGSIMTSPANEQLGYLVSEVFTLLCLLVSVAFAFIMRSNRGRPQQIQTYGIAFAVSILCWLISWLQRPVGDSDHVLMSIVALHGVIWGTRCVALATQSETQSRQSLLLALIGAAACSSGIFLATRPEITKLAAVTIAACYMLCLGLHLFYVSILLRHGIATDSTANG
jgi:hypothetical protein